MSLTRLPRTFLAALQLSLVVAAACGGSDPAPTTTPTQTPVPATATPAGPTATPTPDLAVLLRDGGISIIQTAYDRLLDEYIDPLQPQALLTQAWNGASSEARAEGLSVPAAPRYTGDRVADFTAFLYLGELIERDRTEQLFTRPHDERTEAYLTGRFG